MIFVDSNLPMYLIGAPHPNKDRVKKLLERFVTDVEVYQEIPHRYTAIRRPDAIDAAFASLDATTDETMTFGMSEIRAAREMISSVDGISVRDALRVAIMRSAGVSRILSMDRGFDVCLDIERLS